MPETDVLGDPFREIWYVHENVVLGGWDVTTSGQPPSPTRYEGRTRIGYFLKEPFARRVADLHNADLVGRLPPEGGETRTEWRVRWGDGLEFDAAADSAKHAATFVKDYCARYGERAVAERRYVGPWVAVDQEAADG